MGSLEFRWAVARRAVKVNAVLGFENPKAFGEAIHFYIEGATKLRKLGSAGVFAPGTPKNFHPMVVIYHPASMRLSRRDQASCPGTIKLKTSLVARGSPQSLSTFTKKSGPELLPSPIRHEGTSAHAAISFVARPIVRHSGLAAEND